MLSLLKKIKSVLCFVFLFSVLLAFNAPVVSSLVILAMLLHELGHLLMFFLLNKSVRGVSFATFGAKMSYRGNLSYREEFWICLSGPLSNLLACVFSLLFCQKEYFQLFCYINLFYALTNLLPLPGYDGEKILRTLTSSFFCMTNAQRWIFRIGFLLRILLLFLSLYR